KLYGKQFQPLQGGEFPYGPDNPPPNCGGPGLSNYDDVARNAFYCPANDSVSWDTVNLTNQLLDQFGEFTLAIVVAHELGHAVQARHGILDGRFITFFTEQQADCFAGAYTQFVQQGNSKAFKVSLADLDSALGGFLQIRDPVGTDSVHDESAHGSAFQRINAFEDGLNGGAEKCKSYETNGFDFVPEVIDQGTIDPTGGNLPFEKVEPLVIANLEGFWSIAFPQIAGNKRWTAATTNPFDPAKGVTCGDKSFKGNAAVGKYLYCTEDDVMSWDERTLMPEVHDNIGDLAEGAIVAKLYSQRAEHLAGKEIGTIPAALLGDCFTGVWVATTKTGEVNKTLPDGAVVSLSPGDLDEVVAGFLQFGAKPVDVQAGKAVTGTAFERLSAFRTGFFAAFDQQRLSAGLKACQQADFNSSSNASS